METILRAVWAEGGGGPHDHYIIMQIKAMYRSVDFGFEKSSNHVFFNDNDDVMTAILPSWIQYGHNFSQGDIGEGKIKKSRLIGVRDLIKYKDYGLFFIFNPPRGQSS
jgi:hypothetical protein